MVKDLIHQPSVVKELKPQFFVEYASLYSKAKEGCTYSQKTLDEFEQFISSATEPRDKLYLSLFKATVVRAAKKSEEVDKEYDDSYEDLEIVKRTRMKLARQIYESKIEGTEEIASGGWGVAERVVPAAVAGGSSAFYVSPGTAALISLGTFYLVHQGLKGFARVRKRLLARGYRKEQFAINKDFGKDVAEIDDIAADKKLALFTVEELKLIDGYEDIYKVKLEKEPSAKRFNKLIRTMKARNRKELLRVWKSD
jgi:hypothetical protein